MVTLEVKDGIEVVFDAEESSLWEIFEAHSKRKIGYLEVDDDNMFVHADIDAAFQRKGIATAVVRYLVKGVGWQFTFWKPDGQKYEDARHLSIEGAAWASSLVSQGLARWVGWLEDADDSEF